MQGNRKKATDCVRFFDEYITARLSSIKTKEELSFLLDYYSHLITDAELQRTTRDDERVAAARKRAKEIPELCDLADGLEEFPDYIDYLPKGAIPMKVKMMYYMPTQEEGRYPFVGFSREEYEGFLERAVNIVINAIETIVMEQI